MKETSELVKLGIESYYVESLITQREKIFKNEFDEILHIINLPNKEKLIFLMK